MKFLTLTIFCVFLLFVATGSNYIFGQHKKKHNKEGKFPKWQGILGGQRGFEIRNLPPAPRRGNFSHFNPYMEE